MRIFCIVFHREYLAMHLKLLCLETIPMNNKTTSASNNIGKIGQIITWVDPEWVQQNMKSRYEFTGWIKVAKERIFF